MAAVTNGQPAPTPRDAAPLKLNIVMMSLGSRGDLQPHLRIAQTLQQKYGHRVRLVCSDKYRAQVEAAGVELYSYGDVDPAEMTRRRMLPQAEQQKMIPVLRSEFAQMSDRYWAACVGGPEGIPDGADPAPFMADAIISIMQPFVHSWAAARMGIPLHMVGTNPRSPTRYLPHSQDAVAASADSILRNRVSWFWRDFLILQIFKSGYNNLRLRIGLEPFTPLWFMSQWNRLRVPFTNIWSPNFLPKPKDWGEHIDIAGFVFQDQPDYEPPSDLVRFLAAGDKPIYVGFGSSWIPGSEKIFSQIFQAVSKAGVRAVVLRGSSRLDPEDEKNPDVFIVNDCPHDWLFPRMSAVVISGGAGATGMALKTGRPMVMCPVTADMPFWAHRVWMSGCGPKPLPLAEITADGLAERIAEVMQPQYAAAAAEMATKIAGEAPGAEAFARKAQQSFSVYDTAGRCHVLTDKPAAWEYTGSGSKASLSAIAAHVLIQEGRLSRSQLEPLYVVKWPDLASPGDPVSGLFKSLGEVVGNVSRDLSSIGGRKANEQLYTPEVGEKRVERPTEVLFGVLFLVTHILRAPITVLHSVIFGLYNLVDFINYELGSETSPELFMSNPRLYSYPRMLGYLLLKPFKELGGSAQSPPQLPLATIRFFVALLNVPVGFVALAFRAGDIELSRAMGERPKTDVVAEARLRYGKLEAERLGRQKLDGNGTLVDRVVDAWDRIVQG